MMYSYWDVTPAVTPTPAHAARAALLVARFAAAIQATKELQALRNRPRLLALEKLAYKCLDTGDAAAFLNQKGIFAKIPPPLKEKINRELSTKWRRPPLVGELMDSHTRHLSLELREPEHWDGNVVAWSRDSFLLCRDIVREGKNTLRSLEIDTDGAGGRYARLLMAKLKLLLLGLRALTSLHLLGLWDLTMLNIDCLVSILATTNPDIRSLRLPYLSNKSLCTIADRWPQLEFLQPDQHEFDSSKLAVVLAKLRNLQTLEMSSVPFSESSVTMSEALLTVARAHDPTSPPYKLAGRFTCRSQEPVSSGDVVKVFTAFPALHSLAISETDIPAVCAGLEGREHVHITELVVESTSSNPRALEPLLARDGDHLIKLEVSRHEMFSRNRVDLNMIGHYCPKLEDLKIQARELVSGDEFEVTATHFSKLKICTLHHNAHVNNPADLPTELVCRALASPTLESCDTRGVRITEEVVAALAAEREQGALSSLEELKMWRPTPVRLQVLAELASHAPRLRRLILNSLGWQDDEYVGVLTSFVQQAELDVLVSKSYF